MKPQDKPKTTIEEVSSNINNKMDRTEIKPS